LIDNLDAFIVARSSTRGSEKREKHTLPYTRPSEIRGIGEQRKVCPRGRIQVDYHAISCDERKRRITIHATKSTRSQGHSYNATEVLQWVTTLAHPAEVRELEHAWHV
jgi:hypothetical protein